MEERRFLTRRAAIREFGRRESVVDHSWEMRPMTRREVDWAVDLAEAEGWNPGLGDAEAFFAQDPGGFLMGLVDGEPAGCLSAVSYGPRFGFLGFYIVLPSFRGQGYGVQLWEQGMARLTGRVVGLDAVVAQQENYRKSGFVYAHAQFRFEGVTGGGGAAPEIFPLSAVPFENLCRYDATLFPAERPAFLAPWTRSPHSVGRAWLEDGELRGYGVLRKCRRGYKVGPLFAETPPGAEMLLDQLLGSVPPGEPFFLDVPEPNGAALALVRRRGMEAVFETGRMYVGKAPTVRLEGIFGVTSFELG